MAIGLIGVQFFDFILLCFAHADRIKRNEVDNPAVIHFFGASAPDIFSYDLIYGGVRLLAI